MNKNLLLIFTRNPELGKVKTRLAKTVGNETALEIYKYLLQKTRDISIQVSSDREVYYSVKIRSNDIWDSKNYQKTNKLEKISASECKMLLKMDLMLDIKK